MHAFRSASCILGLAGLMLSCAFAATVPAGTGTTALNPVEELIRTENLTTPIDTGGGLSNILNPGGTAISGDVVISNSPALGGETVNAKN
jgi:hypothetical protein